jgi:hypothetical protein
MLATPIKLHDIDDVQGFVANSLNRTGIYFAQADEREELIAEGVCILYELAEAYEPRRAGYAQAGRFSGFAAQFLPRRLGDAWHKRHPNHRRVAGEDGKRRWIYQDAPVSLDAILSDSDAGQESHRDRGREEDFRPLSHWAPVPVGTQSSRGPDR